MTFCNILSKMNLIIVAEFSKVTCHTLDKNIESDHFSVCICPYSPIKILYEASAHLYNKNFALNAKLEQVGACHNVMLRICRTDECLKRVRNIIL